MTSLALWLCHFDLFAEWLTIEKMIDWIRMFDIESERNDNRWSWQLDRIIVRKHECKQNSGPLAVVNNSNVTQLGPLVVVLLL